MKNNSNHIYVKEIIAIALPVTGQALFNTLMHAVDSKMVSSLGISRIAAVSFTNAPRLLVFALFFAFNTVTTLLVSQYLGKKDEKGVLDLVKTGCLLVTMTSLVLGIGCAITAKPIMSLFVKEAETLAESSLYFKVVMMFCVSILLMSFFNACNVACGASKAILVSGIISNFTNIIFDYLLIDGHLGLPALGIKGAAVATVISQFVGLCISLYYLLKSRKGISFKNLLQSKTDYFEKAKEYAVLWKDVAFSDVTERVSLFILAIINGQAGVLSYSIYTIGLYYLNINFAIAKGMSTACLSLFSKNRDKPLEIEQYIKTIKKILTLVIAVLMVVIPLSSPVVYSFYSKSPEFIEMGTWSGIFLCLIAPFHILSTVLSGILNSFKDTEYVSRVSAASRLLVNCGVSYLCIVFLKLGVYGIWIGCLFSHVFPSVLYILRFKKRQF